MKYITVLNIYLLGFFVSLLRHLFAYCFQGAKLEANKHDITVPFYFVLAVFWPFYLVLVLIMKAVGFKRLMKPIADYMEKKTGERPVYESSEEIEKKRS